MNYFERKKFEWKYKHKMKNFFYRTGLYFTSYMGDKEVKAYPKVFSVKRKEEEGSIQIVFSLLNGLDPKELVKKRFMIFQFFGAAFELEGEYKKFTLTIYDKPLKSDLIYSYDEILPYLKVEKNGKETPMKIPIVVGKKKNGRYLIIDAFDFPHVLIQGVTGSGKSSAIRVILCTLIKYIPADKLTIYCIDGKRAEFSLFKQVESVHTVVYSSRDARRVLQEVVDIMYKREELLDTFEVQHIEELPKEHEQKFIFVAVDEFIEYLDDDKIMSHIIKISSKGRATGIYLLSSAQRMDADVMDTKARGNYNIRMSFRAVDATNANLIGTKGAEKIKIEEKGKAILNAGTITEIQNPHLTPAEAKKLLNPYCVIKNKTKDITPKHTPKQEENPDLKYIDLFDNKD
ncbi:DUF87 domain-containing protein [Shigella flexneri]|nr:DUF87 domain-containing protein [Shigella flexneri]